MGRGTKAALAAVLALSALPAPAAAATVSCSDAGGTVQPLELTVGGAPAHGLYAAPAGPPKGLVVFAHGYTHSAETWRAHLARTAREEGVIAVAMNYRGTIPMPRPGQPHRTRGLPLVRGAQDSVAAAKLFDSSCPGLPRIVAYGVSMGGAVSGLAVATGAKRSDGRPLFDRWIAVEGLALLAETYLELTVGSFTPDPSFRAGREDVERETGGTLFTRPGAYSVRSTAARARDIAASGVGGVTIVHGVDDGTVLVSQSLALAVALRAHGVPVDLFTVVTRDGRSEAGTTLEGALLGLVAPELAELSPFTGHASEDSETHLVGRTGFERLGPYFAGRELPRCLRLFVVDGTLGRTLPDPASQPPCQPTRALRRRARGPNSFVQRLTRSAGARY